MATESSVKIWQSVNDYITLSYVQVRVHYEQAGERITDRHGLVHRLLPGSARYPCALTISVLAEELTALNNAGASTRRCVLEWLEYMFRLQVQLMVYVRGETLADGGSALTRNLAYKGILDSLPEEYSGTLPIIGGGPEYVELRFHVEEDGRFTSFDSLSGYAAFTPSRPGSEA